MSNLKDIARLRKALVEALNANESQAARIAQLEAGLNADWADHDALIASRNHLKALLRGVINRIDNSDFSGLYDLPEVVEARAAIDYTQTTNPRRYRT